MFVGGTEELADPGLEPGLGDREHARRGTRPCLGRRLPEHGDDPLGDESTAAERLREVDGRKAGIGGAGRRERRRGHAGVAAQERMDGLGEQDVGDGVELVDEVVDGTSQLHRGP